MKKENTEKQNNPIFNLAQNFNLIRLFLLIIGASFIVMIASFSYVYLKMQKYSIEKVLKISTKGQIVPMEVVNQRELYEIEAKDHIKTFIELFFDYDEFNYKKKIERALWLGDDSIKEIYQRLKNSENWFDKVVQHSVIQKVIWEDEKTQINVKQIDEQNGVFSAATTLEINSSGNKKYKHLFFKGKLTKVSRHFPLNPHGLLITHFSYTSKELKEN